ncbi:MobA/MobL family protein [Cytobacillus sp. FSL M8-0252]|uniref:MobA/MobL family protein n=1 Tax=Cytobacillus sp. FSL M8-0252 TaxID=2921621 RepID=UPI0030FA7FFD
MGIYYFDAKFVSKAKQSAVAKASYVSNDALYSERDEETKKFRERVVKPESFIIAPSHAPEWVYNRESLWNEAEKVEKQYNAQVQREVVVALPIEISNQEQTNLLREFVQENFVSDGMVADVNIHRDQEHNPHAHILLTVRPFKENGEWFDTKTKKEYIYDENGNPVLNDKGKQKTRNVDLTGWNNKNKLLLWRKNYAEKVNEYYKINGISQSVSHLSYEEQGKEIKAKQRLTRSEFYVEKKEKENAKKNNYEYKPVTNFGRLNSEIEVYNEKIIKLQNEIEQLEKYKENANTFNINKFKDIRNNFVWNDSNFKAVSFVKERQKVKFVNYDVSLKAMDSMKYWKQNIDKKLRSFEREEKALTSVKSMYQDNKDGIARYGFITNNFVKDFNERMSLLNEKYESLTKEVKSYKESYKLVKISHEMQKQLLDKEFEFLYPNYKEIHDIDSFEINEIKNKYVEEFKKNDQVVSSIPELESYEIFTTNEEQDFRNDVWDIVADYRNQSKVNFSLPKKLDKLEQDYLNAIKSSSLDIQEERNDVYKKAILYLSTKNEIKHATKVFEETKNKMFKALIEIYGKDQQATIEKIPDKIKVKLLERFLSERSVNELSEDLKLVKKQQLKDMDKSNDKAKWEPESQSRDNSIGGILTELIDTAKQNEGNYDDLENKRKRAKRRMKKLTKEEILDME